jgi:SAM-dependent methyltransferase
MSQGAGQSATLEELRAEIIRLGPWHLDVEVAPGLTTRAFLDAPPGTYQGTGHLDPSRITFIDPRRDVESLLPRIYPAGLEGRSFLDCACNCGGYSFLAREMGASACFGFDVREHWIAQARFLAEHRTGPSDNVELEVLDLYDLPQRGVGPFDVTLFKGIFYHLPDPVTGLKAAADLTGELLIVDTSTRPDMPEGTLTVGRESREGMMSGVYGLNWRPSGPSVMAHILRWMGFPDTRLAYNHEQTRRGGFGRMRLVAARRHGLLDAFDPVDPVNRGAGRGRARLRRLRRWLGSPSETR